MAKEKFLNIEIDEPPIELETLLDRQHRADELNTMDKIKKFFHN